jgi:hypothetical protein
MSPNFTHQSRLANACLTTHQSNLTLIAAGSLEQPQQGLRREIPSNHNGTDDRLLWITVHIRSLQLP